jgi:hypothetical protein
VNILFARSSLEKVIFTLNHEEAFNVNEIEGEIRKEMLIKYLIHRAERSKVLSKLDIMNINSYSLFIDEESLMETLAYQNIEKDN